MHTNVVPLRPRESKEGGESDGSLNSTYHAEMATNYTYNNEDHLTR